MRLTHRHGPVALSVVLASTQKGEEHRTPWSLVLSPPQQRGPRRMTTRLVLVLSCLCVLLLPLTVRGTAVASQDLRPITVATVPVGSAPIDAAVNPLTNRIYVTNA